MIASQEIYAKNKYQKLKTPLQKKHDEISAGVDEDIKVGEPVDIDWCFYTYQIFANF